MGSGVRNELLAICLAVAIGVSSGACTTGCPTALASGVLAARGHELLLADETGEAHVVAWPDGYSVRQEGGLLVLTNRFGSVMARQGDRIDMGGGVGADDVFRGCGDVVVIGRSLP